MLLMLLTLPAHAQPAGTPLTALTEAFRQGDAPALQRLTSDRLEIALLGESRLYSPAQAEYVLADFFETYPPRRVEIQHETRTDTGWFAEGSYHYDGSPTPLRLYLRLRKTAEGWHLREVLIDENG